MDGYFRGPPQIAGLTRARQIKLAQLRERFSNPIQRHSPKAQSPRSVHSEHSPSVRSPRSVHSSYSPGAASPRSVHSSHSPVAASPRPARSNEVIDGHEYMTGASNQVDAPGLEMVAEHLEEEYSSIIDIHGSKCVFLRLPIAGVAHSSNSWAVSLWSDSHRVSSSCKFMQGTEARKDEIVIIFNVPTTTNVVQITQEGPGLSSTDESPMFFPAESRRSLKWTIACGGEWDDYMTIPVERGVPRKGFIQACSFMTRKSWTDIKTIKSAHKKDSDFNITVLRVGVDVMLATVRGKQFNTAHILDNFTTNLGNMMYNQTNARKRNGDPWKMAMHHLLSVDPILLFSCRTRLLLSLNGAFQSALDVLGANVSNMQNLLVDLFCCMIVRLVAPESGLSKSEITELICNLWSHLSPPFLAHTIRSVAERAATAFQETSGNPYNGDVLVELESNASNLFVLCILLRSGVRTIQRKDVATDEVWAIYTRESSSVLISALTAVVTLLTSSTYSGSDTRLVLLRALSNLIAASASFTWTEADTLAILKPLVSVAPHLDTLRVDACLALFIYMIKLPTVGETAETDITALAVEFLETFSQHSVGNLSHIVQVPSLPFLLTSVRSIDLLFLAIQSASVMEKQAPHAWASTVVILSVLEEDAQWYLEQWHKRPIGELSMFLEHVCNMFQRMAVTFEVGGFEKNPCFFPCILPPSNYAPSNTDLSVKLPPTVDKRHVLPVLANIAQLFFPSANVNFRTKEDEQRVRSTMLTAMSIWSNAAVSKTGFFLCGKEEFLRSMSLLQSFLPGLFEYLQEDISVNLMGILRKILGANVRHDIDDAIVLVLDSLTVLTNYDDADRLNEERNRRIRVLVELIKAYPDRLFEHFFKTLGNGMEAENRERISNKLAGLLNTCHRHYPTLFRDAACTNGADEYIPLDRHTERSAIRTPDVSHPLGLAGFLATTGPLQSPARQSYALRCESERGVQWFIHRADQHVTMSSMKELAEWEAPAFDQPPVTLVSSMQPLLSVVSGPTGKLQEEHTRTGRISLAGGARTCQIFPCNRIPSHRDTMGADHRVVQFECFCQLPNNFDEKSAVEAMSMDHHSPKKHKVYGTSLSNWHQSDKVLGGPILRVTFSIPKTPANKVQFSSGVRIPTVVQDMERINRAKACNRWLGDRRRHLEHCFHEAHSYGTAETAQNMLYEMEYTLKPLCGEVVGMGIARRMIVYFREWEDDFFAQERKKAKLEFVKAKKSAIANGEPLPKLADFQGAVSSRNPLMEKICNHYNALFYLLEECVELLDYQSFRTSALKRLDEQLRGYVL